jgi:hypothetical protein
MKVLAKAIVYFVSFGLMAGTSIAQSASSSERQSKAPGVPTVKEHVLRKNQSRH